MSEQSNAKDLMQCPVCRNTIPQGARKCTKCNSYLNWRRYLNVSETSLALVVALISVISVAAPNLNDWLTEDFSELHAETRQVYRESLELFISNRGNKTGRIISVSLGATTRSGSNPNPLTLEIAHDGLVPPAESTVVHLTVHPEQVLQFLSWPFAEIEGCSLRVSVVEHRQAPKLVDVGCPRDALVLFCKGTEGAAKQFGLISPQERNCA